LAEVEEELLVSSPNTLADPGTVVVVFEDTCPTVTAMVCSIRLDQTIHLTVPVGWMEDRCCRRPSCDVDLWFLEVFGSL